jgi:large repetitive protein
MINVLELFPTLDRESISATLRPLLVAGMATPIRGGDGGINRNLLTQFEEGLLIAIDPYLGKQEGDKLEVLWDGLALETHEVAAGEERERTILFLDTQAMVDGWVEEVLYRLTPVGGPAEDSIPLRLLIATKLPGDYDRDPHLPGHSQLPAPVLPDDVMENGVDASHLEKGVEAKIGWYDNRAPWDNIQLRWGTVSVFHTVTEQEAAGTDPIIILVDQATILAAGDTLDLLVHYQVYDQAWNFSEDWSLRTYVKVDAGAWKLDPPFVKEARDGQLDLSELGDDDATVQVEVRNPPFAYDDTVIVSWVTLVNDAEVGKHDETKRVDKLPAILEVPIPNEVVREGAGGKIVASYVLHPQSGGDPSSSKRTTVTIVGSAPLEAPGIHELIGDRLEPTLERAHVVIPVYEGMAAGDLVNVRWAGTTAAGLPYLHEMEHIVSNNEAGQPFYLGVGEEHIGLLRGGRLDVSYRVSNDQQAPTSVRNSSHLKVLVAALPATLPAPSVNEAPEGVLDPELHPGSVTLRVDYPGTAKGDILTWFWLGEDPENGSAKDWIPITEPLKGKPLTFPIERRLVTANLNSVVRVMYTLKRASDGQFEYSKVLELVIGKLIGELPGPDVLEAPDGKLDPVRGIDGVTVEVNYPSMAANDLITLMWIGTPGVGTPADQQKTVTTPGKMPFKIPANVIGANIDWTVSLAYSVIRHQREQLSDFTKLHIAPLADAQLVSPLITEARQGLINLATFSGNANCTLATTWHFIAENQKVWLYLAGKDAANVDVRIDLLQGKALSAADIRNGISQSVPRSELERLGQDTPLTAKCRVGFAENASEDMALPFPQTNYAFKLHHDWVIPTIERAEDANGEIADGGSTFQSRVTLSGSATLESTLELFDGDQPKGTVQANGLGQWTHVLSGLAPKVYLLTAHARDGSGNVSLPRRFEVLENLTPTIDDVRDSNGAVANGGTTVDTSLTLGGQSSPDRQVEVFDGNQSKGKATSDYTGRWTLQTPGLNVARHSFVAKALYGSGEQSKPWVVNVAQAVKPTLSSVKDSRREVPAGGHTVDTSVTVTGTATANQQVELFDNNQSKGVLDVNASSAWTKVLLGLTEGSHRLKARALYGAQPESAERSFSVIADLAPSIIQVVEPNNTAIPNNGSTYATVVTASGKAAVGQQIELFDGGTALGIVPVDDNGNWSKQVSGLSQAPHVLKAGAVYGANRESNTWSFTVKAVVLPTITSVQDTKGEVPQNGSTTDTRVSVYGCAAANERVEIFDGNLSKGAATVNLAGSWVHAVTNLAVGSHSLRAFAQQAGVPGSNIRGFTVKSPFALDPSPVTLNGRLYNPGTVPLVWPANSTATRIPSNGTPPYTYTSSNTGVVTTDTNGRIYARANGVATITVQDSTGQSGQYNVTVSNVIQVATLGGDLYWRAQQTVAARGMRLPTRPELEECHRQFLGSWPVPHHGWTTTPAPGILKNFAVHAHNGTNWALSIKKHLFPEMGDRSTVYGLK